MKRRDQTKAELKQNLSIAMAHLNEKEYELAKAKQAFTDLMGRATRAEHIYHKLLDIMIASANGGRSPRQ